MSKMGPCTAWLVSCSTHPVPAAAVLISPFRSLAWQYPQDDVTALDMLFSLVTKFDTKSKTMLQTPPATVLIIPFRSLAWQKPPR